MKFLPIKTLDNTISLYSHDFDDVYHSNIGAYTEAMHKYAIPSGIVDFAVNNKKVSILDVCYGLGYNSKAAVNEILKVNSEVNIYIAALEIDPVVVAFSTLIGVEILKDDINSLFYNNISKYINVKKHIEEYLSEYNNISPSIKQKNNIEYKVLSLEEIKQKLHNIYYRSISTSNSIDKKTTNININTEFYINDARLSVQNIENQFDFIFLDPFTPSRMPCLWTIEFFQQLYRLLKPDGNITTYSNASPVRNAMIETGFYLEPTQPLGKKTTGTIAYKKQKFVSKSFSEKEKGILITKAGIPYRDPSLNLSNDEILKNHQREKNFSDLSSSSRFLKAYKN